jgi:hypothetical protein
MRPLLRRPRVGWVGLGCCVFGLLLCSDASPARAQPVPLADDPAPAQRQELERQARVLNQQGIQHYQHSRWDEALKLWERAGG